MQSRGFEEIPHTADWAIRVWGEDLPALFTEAAQGMNALSGVQLKPTPRAIRMFEHEAPDAETLLVAFLSEILFLEEQQGLGFDKFTLRVRDTSLEAEMEGAPLISLAKAIKAVTFHGLRIARTRTGCEAKIIFDV